MTAPDAGPRRTRRARISWPQVRAQWPLALVIVGLMAAMALVAAERWRRGAFLVGAVALGAAVLRMLLPQSRAGLLTVRGRVFDVVFLVVTGGVAIWLSVSIDSLGTG